MKMRQRLILTPSESGAASPQGTASISLLLASDPFPLACTAQIPFPRHERAEAAYRQLVRLAGRNYMELKGYFELYDSDRL